MMAAPSARALKAGDRVRDTEDGLTGVVVGATHFGVNVEVEGGVVRHYDYRNDQRLTLLRPTNPVAGVTLVDFPEFGCWLGVKDGVLLFAPSDVVTGLPDNEIGEVCNAEGDRFLPLVNKYFGTAFTLEAFDAR